MTIDHCGATRHAPLFALVECHSYRHDEQQHPGPHYTVHDSPDPNLGRMLLTWQDDDIGIASIPLWTPVDNNQGADDG